MSNVGIELFVVLILSLLNGILAMAEIAIVSASRGKLATLADAGNARAKRASALAENPTQCLATVQIGITLVGIVSGVYGGATLADDLASKLMGLGLSAELASVSAYLTVVGTITYLSVVVGELIPKQIALGDPERIALVLAGPVSILSQALRPAVWLLESSSLVLTQLLPFRVGARAEVSEDDIRHMIAQGAETGEIAAAEKDIAFRVFRLADRPIRAYMTGRSDVVWLEEASPVQKLYEIALHSPYSFFPVAHSDLDEMLGVVSLKDLCVLNQDRSLALRDFIRPVIQVPSTKNALSVLEDFKTERRHMAIVVDERGSIEGVVTTHDLLEALVGDLADYEGEERSMVKRGDGSYLVDAALDIHELLLEFEIRSADATMNYNSVGGVVFGALGAVPKLGAKVIWNGLVFEVIDMDGYRIDKLLVSRVSDVPLTSGMS